MRAIGIIPARLASTRFPNKPMAPILGTPMIGHVYLRSKMSRILDEVYVATCDLEIAQYVESIDGKAVMTARSHKQASDRPAEALLAIERENNWKCDIVVLIQGDEPMIVAEMVDEGVGPLLKDA